MKTMALLMLVICLVAQTLLADQKQDNFPEFEFDVWGRPPSQKVYDLTKEKVVQNILFSIKENAFSTGEIATTVGSSESIVVEKIK